MLKNCRDCGAPNDVEASKCSACGSRFRSEAPSGLRGWLGQVIRPFHAGRAPAKECPICGSSNDVEARCCSSCGARFREKALTYDVFISYRRDGGSHLAALLKLLLERDYKRQVFLDVDELQVGRFDEKLLELIESTGNFVLILTGRCLDRCTEKNDWLKREIVHALATGRNIIPVLVDDFRFPGEDVFRDLPEAMRILPNLQGVHYSHTHRDSAVQKIAEYLRAVAPFERPQAVSSAPISRARIVKQETAEAGGAPSAEPAMPIRVAPQSGLYPTAATVETITPAIASAVAAPLPILLQPAAQDEDLWASPAPRFGTARMGTHLVTDSGTLMGEPGFGLARIGSCSFVEGSTSGREPRFGIAAVRQPEAIQAIGGCDRPRFGAASVCIRR